MKFLVAGIAVMIVFLSGYRAGEAMQDHKARLILTNPSADIQADSIQSEKNDTTRATGQVQIVIGKSVITADEAVVHDVQQLRTAKSIDLRGNVRMIINP